MINGIVASEVCPLFVQLQNLNDFEFYLTGSRYFGNACVNSDYDFFVQYSAKLKAALEELGYVKLQFKYYDDQLTAEVYRIKGYLWENKEYQVDIQLVRDADLKNRAQELIYNNVTLKNLLAKLPSNKRDEIWNLVFNVASHQAKWNRPGYNKLTVNVKNILGFRD